MARFGWIHLCWRSAAKPFASATDHFQQLSYTRVSKRAALMAGSYIHAKQFKPANRELSFLRTRLGRLAREIARKTRDDERVLDIFVPRCEAHQIRW